MKLPKKIKRKWLRALRSGTYKQGRSMLYNEETAGFCCLGVLQHCVTGGKVEAWDDTEWAGSGNFKGMPSNNWLNSIGAVGWDHDVPKSKHVGTTYLTKLATMNDSGRKSFNFIADWIEKNIGTTD